MAIFNSYVSHYQRVQQVDHPIWLLTSHEKSTIPIIPPPSPSPTTVQLRQRRPPGRRRVARAPCTSQSGENAPREAAGSAAGAADAGGERKGCRSWDPQLD